MYPVITINREFGSGGHTIAKAVAERLNVPFYDGKIVERCSQESGYTKEIIEEQGESARRTGRWFDVSNTAAAMYFKSPQDEIFLAQRRVIVDAAKEGPCVIVGRCADYILDQIEPPLHYINVLIHADMEAREKRVNERYEAIEGVDAKKRILKKDKERSAFYRFYTDRNFGEYSNYDLVLNSATFGEEACIDTICKMAELLNN